MDSARKSDGRPETVKKDDGPGANPNRTTTSTAIVTPATRRGQYLAAATLALARLMGGAS